MLRPNQLKAIDLLVAGASDTHAASFVKVNPSTLWRWRFCDDEFAMELKNRTADSTSSACRVVGAQVRAAADVGLLATQQLQKILLNADAPGWMKLGAAQAAMKQSRWAADKVDKEFNKVETVGRNDPERQKVADDLTRRLEAWEHRDRTLARLQEYEERRMRERMKQREEELLRRLNSMCRLGAQDQEYMHRFYRREDDWDEAMETARREQARQEFAQAAGLEVSELPEARPIKWADLREQFKDFITPLPDPQTPEQDQAEIERATKLSYVDPQSSEAAERNAEFEANFQKVEADYRANVLPKTPPSPIERETRGMAVSAMSDDRGMGVSPMSDAGPQAAKDTHGPEAHATKWTAPIPDRDSPDREAYLATLGDDELPELSESDRQRKADWDQRRKRSEENERIHAKQQKKGA